MPTLEESIEAAFRRLREQQITPTLIRDDRAIVRSECLEAFVEAADMAGTHLWVGAASEAAWPPAQLYFTYPHELPDTATAVVDAFRAEGFEVEWNGDRYKSVRVELT